MVPQDPGTTREQPGPGVDRARARGLAVLAPLDEEQRAVVLALEGPTLLVAGPGTGKTRVLAHRLAYLCAAAGVQPRRILAITHDDEEADRLRERAQRLLGAPIHGAWLGTFHSVAHRILRAHAAAIGRKPSFRILPEAEAWALIRRAAREAGMDLAGQPAARVRESFAAARGRRVPLAGVAGQLHVLYERSLAEANALDPDDVLQYAGRLLDENPGLRERYRRRFEHVLVDRLEDATPPQLELLARLAAPAGNVLAAADDDEALPSLDGTGAIDAFLRDFEGARRLTLTGGYRLSRRILYVATRVIRRGPRRLDKEVIPRRRRGARVVALAAGDEVEEAAAVVAWIGRLLARGEVRPSRVAILTRHELQARPFEEALARAGLPYQVPSGIRFWERREVRDLMSYLRLAVGGDVSALARVANVPRRGIGPASVVTIGRLQQKYRVGMGEAALRAAQLPRVTAQRAGALADLGRLLAELEAAARQVGAAELIDFIVERTGYGAMLGELSSAEEETRRAGIEELRGVARGVPGPAVDALPRLFEHAASVSSPAVAYGVPAGEDAERAAAHAAGGVRLLTLARAKGYEMDVVFLAGLEEGLLPDERALREGDEGLAAERRLCYIGMTRARERLFLTRALSRTLAGVRVTGTPSRFLQEAGRRVRRFRLGSARPGAAPGPTAVPEPAALRVVHEAQRVTHPRYGAGTVVSVQGEGAQAAVTVRFDGGAEKRLVLGLARLRPE